MHITSRPAPGPRPTLHWFRPLLPPRVRHKKVRGTPAARRLRPIHKRHCGRSFVYTFGCPVSLFSHCFYLRTPTQRALPVHVVLNIPRSTTLCQAREIPINNTFPQHWACLADTTDLIGRPEAATLRLAVVVTIASAATVRVVGVAVRRVPLLRTTTIRPGLRRRKRHNFPVLRSRSVHLCGPCPRGLGTAVLLFSTIIYNERLIYRRRQDVCPRARAQHPRDVVASPCPSNRGRSPGRPRCRRHSSWANPTYRRAW
jgi:hypothetical protein